MADKLPSPRPLAKIRIELPKGCIKRALSIDALDAHTRKLAEETFIWVNDQQLLCTAFTAEYPNGKDPVLREPNPRAMRATA